MNKLILVSILLLSVFSACSKKSKDPLIGHVYMYQNGNEKQTVGFSDEKIYLVWDDSLGKESFEGNYTTKYINDTTAVITLKEKPKSWESLEWNILIRENGILSVASKKFYNLKAENKK
jgi:hypothetical protein